MVKKETVKKEAKVKMVSVKMEMDQWKLMNGILMGYVFQIMNGLAKEIGNKEELTDEQKVTLLTCQELEKIIDVVNSHVKD